MTIDRRRSRRQVVQLWAAWRRAHRDVDCMVHDVGLHGMLVSAGQPIELNHVMELCVFVPTGRISLLVTSRFESARRWGRVVGTAILAADPRDADRWAAFYRTLGPRPTVGCSP